MIRLSWWVRNIFKYKKIYAYDIIFRRICDMINQSIIIDGCEKYHVLIRLRLQDIRGIRWRRKWK